MSIKVLKKDERNILQEDGVNAVITYSQEEQSSENLYTITYEESDNRCKICMHVPYVNNTNGIEYGKCQNIYKKAIEKALELGYDKMATSLMYSDKNENINPEGMMEAFDRACYSIEDEGKLFDIYLAFNLKIMSWFESSAHKKKINNAPNNILNRTRQTNPNCFEAVFVTNGAIAAQDNYYDEETRALLAQIPDYKPKAIIDEWIKYYNGNIAWGKNKWLKKSVAERRLDDIISHNTYDAILAGRANTSKLNLIYTALAFEMDYNYAEKFLNSYGETLNIKKNRDDAIFKFFIDNRKTPKELEEKLSEY